MGGQVQEGESFAWKVFIPGRLFSCQCRFRALYQFWPHVTDSSKAEDEDIGRDGHCREGLGERKITEGSIFFVELFGVFFSRTHFMYLNVIFFLSYTSRFTFDYEGELLRSSFTDMETRFVRYMLC